MSQEERMESTPEETGTPTSPSPAEETTPATPPVEETVAPAEEAKTDSHEPEAPARAEVPVYRWTYADQTTHDLATDASKKRKGILIYAMVMTGVFLVSFGLLIAVLIGNRDGGYSGGGINIRPSGVTAGDDVAVDGVEQAKYSVVVIETRSDTSSGTGTGIIMTSDGYIATNHHVIAGAKTIKVTFHDGTVMQAEFIGSSEMDDLGVIKVNATGLPAATFADSDACYVGQTVYAIGTPAGPDFGWTTTKGIISYKNREVKMYDDDGTLKKKLRLLQTDANVNPGNSGGPLVNTAGEVVGVVSMKLADGFEGIGFAIPSDGAVDILEAIMQYGNADSINSSLSHKRPMLGITCVQVEGGVHYRITDVGIEQVAEENLGLYSPEELIFPQVSGVYVMGFAEGMDAAAKMQVGDIITGVNGEEIESRDHLMALINEHYAGDTITLTVYRNGKSISVSIVLSPQA